MLDKITKLIERTRADYIDVRLVNGDFTSILLKDSQKEVFSNRKFGLGVRILKDGSWGFASCNSEDKVQEAFDKASKLAGLNVGKIALRETKSIKTRVRTKYKVNPRDVDINQKISDMVETENSLKMEKVVNTTVSYSDSIYEKIFLNSEGSEITQEICAVFLSMSALVKEGSSIQSSRDRIGKNGGYEVLAEARELAVETGNRARALLDAKLPPKGHYTTVMDGKLVGVLAHEATGHACEADGILANNSILENRIGTKIASDMVSISDSPRVEDGFGYYEYDDEGVETGKTELITNGVLTSYLHSRETACELDAKPTGNARVGSYENIPIVRMSNTFFGPGDFTNEEMFEDVKLGIYARGMHGGQVVPKLGSFVFAAEDGWLIENGKLTTYLRDILLNGYILETLNQVDAVGKDFVDSPGMCGKMGQSVPVSDGGPHVRVKKILIGGQ
ncbi:TldD/PmbA family protein [Candidatus Micrarchaeota archaeon]|nr:TldD/PmbA family protein [Candidatus Micrarchaeota archaeon]